ncbi:hypothetical protein Fmac_006744 [Flemingia macrophylla]|uniref:Uncharacterized protein n=1 Tax=Flemingia macrophylla TaxID=520843 RepID=A0ABD1NBG7_9FABA
MAFRLKTVAAGEAILNTTALKNDIFFLKKRSIGSLSSTPRFSNFHSPSSSSSVFASSTSSFSRSTSFFHRPSSPTCVNLSAPSVRFSLDRSVSPNRSIPVSSQWRQTGQRTPPQAHHPRTALWLPSSFSVTADGDNISGPNLPN